MTKEVVVANPYAKPSSLAFKAFEMAKRGTSLAELEKMCKKAEILPARIIREIRLQKFRGLKWDLKETDSGKIHVRNVTGKFTKQAAEKTKKSDSKPATKKPAIKTAAKTASKKKAAKKKQVAGKVKEDKTAEQLLASVNQKPVLTIVSPMEVAKRLGRKEYRSYKELCKGLKAGERVTVREDKKGGKPKLVEVIITTDGWQLEDGPALPE